MIKQLVDLGSALPRRWAGKRIGYIGWIGRGNLGDDAMFEAAERLFGKSLEPIQTVTREKVLSKLGAGGARAFDLIVLGGGTLINAGRLDLVRWLLSQQVPLVTLGSGVGSSGFAMAEEGIGQGWAEVLTELEHVGLRGPVSLRKVRSAGVPNAEIIGDLALALTPQQPLADWTSRRAIMNLAPVRSDAESRDFEAVYDSFLVKIRDLTQQDWEVTLVAFDEEDVAVLERLTGEAGLATRVEHPTDFEAYCRLAQGCSLSLGMRLHSSVFASACGIPNVLIAYRDKCRDFAETVGLEGSLVPLDDFAPDQFEQLVQKAVSDGERMGRNLHGKSLELQKQLEQYVVRLKRELISG